MSSNGKFSLGLESKSAPWLKEQLADILTLIRIIIALVIVSLSFVGKDAYTIVIVLALIGATTDIFDGKAARHYIGGNRKSKLGKYDIEVDTLFVLCIMAYLSFSEIVISRLVGLGLIGFALTLLVLYKKNLKILLLIEISSVVALLVLAGLYNLETFLLIILPAMTIGIIINRRRVLYLMFKYWPKLFLQ
ncbi:CDP-alcohol phosphatidyltransferase family protein [Chloroflexota bacterium]